MTGERDDLPIPDFDHIPPGTLPSRISALDAAGVRQLLDRERAHGDRLPVTEVLEQRIGALQSGAEPSGAVDQDRPGMHETQSGSAVSPTAGPHIDPPTHDVMGDTTR